MQSALRYIFAFTLTVSSAVHAADTDPLQIQIDQLNQKIAELEQQVQSNRQSVAVLLADRVKDAVSLNGFASFGLSKTSSDNKDNAPYYYGQKKDLSVLPNTWFGLRLDAQLYESGQMIIQVIGKGNDNESLEVKTEWFFLKQELGAGFNAHIGRIRFPTYLDSEVLYVGNLYPTVTPAAEIYSVLSVNYLDGVSLNHSLPLGNWVMDTKMILWGQAETGRVGNLVSLDEVQGVALSFSNDNWTLRTGIFRGHKTIHIQAAANHIIEDDLDVKLHDRLDYFTSAIRFDDRRFHFTLEGVALKSKKEMMDEVHNWNMIIGAYIGNTLLYTGYSRQHVSNMDELTASQNANLPAITIYPSIPVPAGNIFAGHFNRQQRGVQLGAKHDLTPKVALKAQVQYLSHFEGTHGNFAVQVDLPSFRNVIIYDVALQAFF